MKKKILSVLLSLAFSVSFLGLQPVSGETVGTEGSESVCRIGSTGYGTLTDALGAVAADQTIVLLADISHPTPITAGSFSFAIDLAGHALSVSTASMYCLAATGANHQLFVHNSSASSSNLSLTQVITDTDMAAAANYGAIFAGGTNCRVVIPLSVQTGIVSNMRGLRSLGSECSILIGAGSITAARNGISAVGNGSITYTGSVSATGSGAVGIEASNGAHLSFTGPIQSDEISVAAYSNAQITVTGNVKSVTNGAGVYATNGASAAITGSVTAVSRGVFAESGTISVIGNVTAGANEGIGAMATSIPASENQGKVTVTGSVTGGRYGVLANSRGQVVVSGNVTSAHSSGSYTSAGVCAEYAGSVATVNGKVTAVGQYNIGAASYAGGAVYIDGSIEATDTGSCGARALSGQTGGVSYGSDIKIGGTISAPKYILISAAEKAIGDTTEPSLIAGYRMYTGASPVCRVYVKQAAEQTAAPTASPAGGAVPAGTTVTLTSATAGAEIRYTLDGSAPTASSALYTQPVPVGAPLTIRAIAVKSGMADSPELTVSYTIAAAAYPVTVNDSFASVSGSGLYAAGATVSLAAGERSGFLFAGWTSSDLELTDAGRSETSFLMPDKAVTVTANWTRIPVEYSILQGAGGLWPDSSGTGLTFVCNGSYAGFTGAQVDGRTVSSSDIAVESGSTVLTLKPAFLRTLAEGQHTLRMLYADGYAQTSFSVSRSARTNPQTGVA